MLIRGRLVHLVHLGEIIGSCAIFKGYEGSVLIERLALFMDDLVYFNGLKHLVVESIDLHDS